MTPPPIPARDPRSTPKAGDTLIHPYSGEKWHVIDISRRRKGETRMVYYLSSFQRGTDEQVMTLDGWRRETELWDIWEVAR